MKKIALFLFLAALSAKAQPKEASGIRFENIAYPYPVSEMNLIIQGEKCQMAYMDVQPEKPNGKNILLLHGKNFSGLYWGQTAKDLSAAGYRVIIPDQIGFGKSSKPTTIQYSFQLLAQNTKAILDQLGIAKTTVLGHSMGGMLATRFALMYPETAEKLILENPIGLEDWKLDVPYPSVDESQKAEMKQNYESMKQYQRDSYYGGDWKPEYDALLLPFAGWTLNPEYKTIAKCSALTYDMVFTQPVLYEFPKIKTPTLLIIGQRDRTALGKAQASESAKKRLGNYPELGKKTADAIPGCKLVPLDNVGHLPHIEAYESFINAVKTFLKS